MNNFSGLAMLQTLPDFAHMSAEALTQLTEQAIHRIFATNEVLFLESEPSAGLWVVENGRLAE